ncbi:hypothetical protein PLICRDRAFT_43577 [Plicaturopsis crispa FD-325 SS-3]|nr:hypothetical protein PLICRDRAFT_43577 [Plicaturopsis crispa FD-325 SS-3]
MSNIVLIPRLCSLGMHLFTPGRAQVKRYSGPQNLYWVKMHRIAVIRVPYIPCCLQFTNAFIPSSTALVNAHPASERRVLFSGTCMLV